ncbi:MAG: hypothetical protein V1670_00150 [Candidatus Omnitrophota bacterium]
MYAVAIKIFTLVLLIMVICRITDLRHNNWRAGLHTVADDSIELTIGTEHSRSADDSIELTIGTEHSRSAENLLIVPPAKAGKLKNYALHKK